MFKRKCHHIVMSPNLTGTGTEMSPTWNVTKNKMSSKLKYYWNWNITKTEMSKDWNITKTEMLPKLKYPQNWNVTKTNMSLKPKYQQNWNVSKTEKIAKRTAVSGARWKNKILQWKVVFKSLFWIQKLQKAEIFTEYSYGLVL